VETHCVARVMTSGRVKTYRIGLSAAKSYSDDSISNRHGCSSETRCRWADQKRHVSLESA